MRVENIVAPDMRTDGVVVASLYDAYFGPSVKVSCQGRQSIVRTLKQEVAAAAADAAAAAADLVFDKLVAASGN